MKLPLISLLLGTLLGCAEWIPEKPAAAPQAAQAQPAPAQVAAEPQQPPRPANFLKREAKLVDMNKALAENDKLVEVENRISANNYVSALSQSYFALGSRVQVLNLKHQIDIMYNVDERYPSFQEFSDLLRQSGVKLGQLYEWQMYAYDDKTGEIGILEDRALKKQKYEASGREYPHAE
jgi:hypothetical protein